MEDKIKELQTQINSYTFPLTYTQTLKRDNLIKELNKLKTQIFIRQIKGE